MGLGSIHTVTLKEAREKALNARKLLLDGQDPIDTRQAAIQARAGAITFRQAALRYVESHGASWTSKKHAASWVGSLDRHVYPVFGDLLVGLVDTRLVLKCLEPIWTTNPVTASRVRNRIEAVLDWANARGYRTGENPARWRGHLKNLLPAPKKLTTVKHHAALPYTDIAPFMAEARTQHSVAARAMEFLILTAARTGEVRFATWPEIDLDSAIWIIPAERMKSGREHRVPLSKRALAVLKILADENGMDGVVFAGVSKHKPIGMNAFRRFLEQMGRANITTHGFRSTFRDWCAECTAYPREVCEMALAHAIGNQVEAAYRRGDLFEKRRRLMDEWSRYCEATPRTGNIVAISGSRPDGLDATVG